MMRAGKVALRDLPKYSGERRLGFGAFFGAALALLFGIAFVPVQAQDTSPEEGPPSATKSPASQEPEQQENAHSESRGDAAEQSGAPQGDSQTYTFPFERMAAQPEGAPSQAAESPPPAQSERSTQPAESTSEPAKPESANPQASSPAGETNAIETIPVNPPKKAEKKEPPPSKNEAQNAVELGTVTVTAERRAQSIREVPGTIAAITGEELEKRGSRDFEDILKLTPGVSFSKFGERSGIIIRGINTDTKFGVQQQTTGIYIDDIPFSDPFFPGSIPDLNPFDLERVEVLKGPQGTLFGSASLGGAINYITEKPQLNVFQSKLMATGTSFSEGGKGPLGAGMFNIPVGQMAAIRGVGLYRMVPGFIDDIGRGLKDVNTAKQAQGRLQAKWLPLERLSLTATYLRQTGKSPDSGSADQPKRLERRDTPTASPSHDRFDATNLVAQYDFDWGTLLSSTSRNHKLLFGDADVTRIAQTDPNNPGTPGVQNQNEVVVRAINNIRATITTQEFRLISPEGGLGRWKWLVGAFFLRDRQNTLTIIPSPFIREILAASPLPIPNISQDTPLGPSPNTDNAMVARTITAPLGTELALYGEITRQLGERWRITAGGREFQNRLTVAFDDRGLLIDEAQAASPPDPNNPTASVPTGTEKDRTKFKQGGFNPKFSVQFQATRDITAYVLASKGFRFGGSNGNLPPDPETGQRPPETYKSDSLWNFELGTRTEWLNHRLSFDATLFYERWKDLQLTLFTASGLLAFVTNAGLAHSAGAELGLNVIPLPGTLPGLRFNSAAAWVRALTDQAVDTSSGTVPKGTTLPGAPRFQMANTLSYETQLGRWAPGLSATHSHIGPSFNDIFGSAVQGGYETLDFRVHLLRADLPMQPDLSFVLNNALDKRGITGVFTQRGLQVRDFSFIKPRTMELTLNMRF